MLEISQCLKDKYQIFSLICGSYFESFTVKFGCVLERSTYLYQLYIISYRHVTKQHIAFYKHVQFISLLN